jgi:DNA-directed RNA polymerase specialized sigma24 family protein
LGPYSGEQSPTRTAQPVPEPSEAPAQDGRPADMAGFEGVTLPHLPSVYRLAVRLVGDVAAAEDHTQETYLKAMQAFPSLRDRGRVGPWLFQILSRLVVDRHRGSGHEVPLDESIDLDRFSLYDRIAEEDPFPYSERLHDDFLAQFQDEDIRRALLSIPEGLSRAPRARLHGGIELPRAGGIARLSGGHGDVPLAPRSTGRRVGALGMCTTPRMGEGVDAMRRLSCEEAIREFVAYLDGALSDEPTV